MENNYGNRSYQDWYRNRDSDWQNRNSDDDYSNRNRDGYRSENDWNNSQQSNRYQGNLSDRNNDHMEDNYGSNYGSGQNYNRYGNSGSRNDENRYGGSGGNQWNRGMNYGNSGYYGGRSNYGRNDGSNRDNDNQMNRDRDWWDRTSDEISSWFGDDDAKRRRRMDRVMGPHRGKGPKGYTRPDEKIREDVNEKLYHDSHIDASDIDVTVNNGDVTLSGTVENRFSKRHAEDLAESVTGVSDVSNNLKVNKTQDYNTGITNTDTSTNRSGMNGITDNNDTNRRRTTSSV